MQIKPRSVLLAIEQVPPFLQGFVLHPSSSDSQRLPGWKVKHWAQKPKSTAQKRVTNAQRWCLTCEPLPAFTSVVINELHAVLSSTDITRVRQALIYISFTAFSNKTWQAVTVVATYPVNAFPTIETFRLMVWSFIKWIAVIYVNFTMNTWKKKTIKKYFMKCGSHLCSFYC